MELWRLRYFVVLAEVLHFGRAAELLHITQPALSQQVKKLEAALGVQLVVRGRQTRLTPAGVALAESARSLLEQVDRVTEEVRAAAVGMRGTLRVILTRSAPAETMHGLLERFRAAYPDMGVRTETAWTTHNLEELRRGSADVAVVLLPLEDATGLRTREVERLELSIILPADHRLARRRRIAVKDLAEEHFVAWPREQAPGAWDRAMSQLGCGGVPDIVRVEPDIERMMTSVRDGHGVTFATRARARQLRRPGLLVRDLAPPAPEYVFGLCWDPGSDSLALQAFLELVTRMEPENDSG